MLKGDGTTRKDVIRYCKETNPLIIIDEISMNRSMITVLVLNERYDSKIEMRSVFEEGFTHWDEDYVHYQSASNKIYYLNTIMGLLFDGKFEDNKGLLR